MRQPAGRRQHGYTLIEALVAVAIIGMISLVAVPNFMTYYRSGRIKSSLRQLTTEVRNVRQVAVTEQGCAMISFTPGTTTDTSRTWETWRGDLEAGQCTNWEVRGSGILQQSVYFRATTFGDWVDEPPGSGTNDIVFKPNGSTSAPAVQMYSVTIQTTFDVPKNAFRVEVFPSGQLKVVEP